MMPAFANSLNSPVRELKPRLYQPQREPRAGFRQRDPYTPSPSPKSGHRRGLESQRSVIYSLHVIDVRQTTIFREWLDGLADRRAVERIAQRIVRLQAGLFGDVKPVGGGVSELRIDYGPGYRVYFVRHGQILIILLCGGAKRTQKRDIARAQALAAELEVE